MDTDISGHGRSSPDMFTPAAEAVGGLFSSLSGLAAPRAVLLPGQATSVRENLTQH